MQNLTSVLLILTYFGAGYMGSQLINEPTLLAKRLNKFIVNFVFPAVILRVVPGMALPAEAIFMAVAPWIIIAVLAPIIYALSRLFNWNRETLCAALVLAPMGNTGMLGYPMIKAFFSDQQLGTGIIFDQFGSLIAFCSYATILVTLFSSSERVNAQKILLSIVRFPPFIAFLVALFLPHDFFGTFSTGLLQMVGWTVMPLALFSIGLQFRFRTEASLILPIAWTLALKMLIAPLIILVLGKALGISDWILDIAIFQAAMPPIFAGAVILSAAGLAMRFTASVLSFGTLIGLIFLPLLAFLLNLN